MDFRVVGNGHRQSLHGARWGQCGGVGQAREKSGDTIMWYVVLDVILLSGRTVKKTSGTV